MSAVRTTPKDHKEACAAIAEHLREHGPLPGCHHILDQLIELDAAFPGLSFRDFVISCALAVSKGSG